MCTACSWLQEFEEGGKGKEIQLATATVKPGQRKAQRMGISLSKREKQRAKPHVFANGGGGGESSSGSGIGNRRASTLIAGGADEEEKKSSSSKKSKPKHQGTTLDEPLATHTTPVTWIAIASL